MVKAAQVTSSQEFLKLLEKSGLLTEQQLAEVRPVAGQSEDSKAFARHLISRLYVTKWQATQLLNGFGQFSVGKYRLLDQLGVGRLGREFLAEHLQLGRRVALKLVSRELTAQPKRLKTFLAEFRRAGSLDHAHLVHSHDVDQEGQRYYVVTEYVDGENLQQRVQKTGPLSVAETINLVKQAAEGLAFAASSGVIHGDLKPSNLLVDREGVLKVSDLGFARLVDVSPPESAPRDSQEHALSDISEYSAPETLNDVEGDMDARADIYSLGQIVYFLMTGQAPPASPASMEERQTLLIKKQPNLPAEVARLYARFTAPVAADRPADWTEVLQQLSTVSTAIPQEPVASEKAIVNEVAPTAKRTPVAQAIAIFEVDDSPDSIPVVIKADEPQPFIIDTKSSSRGKGTAKKATSATSDPEASPVQPVVNEDAATVAHPEKKAAKGAKSLNPKLVLGGVIGGGVLLLLVAVGVMMALIGGGQNDASKQVAKATAKEKKVTTKSTTADVKTNPTEVNPSEVNPTEVNPAEVNPTSLTATDAQPALEAGKETTPATSATDSGMPPMPAAEKTAEPTPTPPPTAPAESKPEVAPAAPKTETPTAEPAKPDPPKPEAPKAEPPKSEPPKPAAPASTAKPFEKLPQVVDLPALPSAGQSAAPAVLGEIHVSPEQLVSILLNGGEDAARGKQVFSLQNANGTDPRNWEISVSGKGGEESVVIAKLHLDQNHQFGFEWTPAAAEQAASPYLANCLLKMSAGKDVSTLALRKPVETEEPVTLDMEKGSVLKLPVDNTPDPKKVRVELVGLNPAMFPNPEFRPEATVEAAKGTMYVWVGDTPEKRGLGLRVDTADKSKFIEVRLQPQFRLDPQAPPVKWTKKLLPDLSARLEQSMAALTAQSAAVQASKLPQDRKDQAKTAFDQEQTKAKDQRERVLAAIELHKRMHEAAVVHVRVTYATEAGPVVLAQTKGVPPPAEEAARPAK